MGSYFIEKVDNIQAKLDNVASGLSSVPPSSNGCLHPCNIMDRFSQLLENDVHKVIKSSAKKSLKFDPMPTLVSCQLQWLTSPCYHQDINLSLSTGYFLTNGNPLLKKPGLDLIFKNYRPVCNLQDVPKQTSPSSHGNKNVYRSSSPVCVQNTAQYRNCSFESNEWCTTENELTACYSTSYVGFECSLWHC